MFRMVQWYGVASTQSNEQACDMNEGMDSRYYPLLSPITTTTTTMPPQIILIRHAQALHNIANKSPPTVREAQD